MSKHDVYKIISLTSDSYKNVDRNAWIISAMSVTGSSEAMILEELSKSKNKKIRATRYNPRTTGYSSSYVSVAITAILSLDRKTFYSSRQHIENAPLAAMCKWLDDMKIKHNWWESIPADELYTLLDPHWSPVASDIWMIMRDLEKAGHHRALNKFSSHLETYLHNSKLEVL